MPPIIVVINLIRVFKVHTNPEFGKELANGSLVAHRQTQHGVAKVELGQVGNEEYGSKYPKTYRMTFTAK